MYNVNMYKDARGKCQVCQLIKQLDEDNSKQAKGALKQIYYHIARIERKGTRAGENITKQLREDIWEIRPGKYRITYVIKGNEIILLTWFRKETQKTPNSEIEKAERVYKDWQNNHGQ